MSVRKSKGKFAARYPKAAGLVTTKRELQVGWISPLLTACAQALDLIMEAGRFSSTHFIANTSQSLTCMPVKEEKEDLPCITPTP